MKHKLLIVLEAGPSAETVCEYVGRACAGMTDPDAGPVLFTMLPGLPPWIEAGEAGDAAIHRDQIEREHRLQTERILAQARNCLVAHGVGDTSLRYEIAEETSRIVPEILGAATRHGCDTIVMARHHKSMIQEFFAGDSEEKLLRHPTGFTIWVVE